MLDEKKFFEQFAVEKEFNKAQMDWKILKPIHEDYSSYRNELEDLCEEIERYLFEHLSASADGKKLFHSIRCRRKDPDHLIEKIIRKSGKEYSHKYQGINVSNYREIVRDLIGVRILVFSKEDWEGVFDKLVSIFPQDAASDMRMAEEPVAYTRYGDRDIFKGKIHKEHSNKGYRSQHYVVWFKSCYCEIQVRTLTEEVYGEFDHIVKYPYRDDNKFLLRYTRTLSQLLGSVDELISTCFQLADQGWVECDKYYRDDRYVDWKSLSQMPVSASEDEDRKVRLAENGMIDMLQFANDSIMRKE